MMSFVTRMAGSGTTGTMLLMRAIMKKRKWSIGIHIERFVNVRRNF